MVGGDELGRVCPEMPEDPSAQSFLGALLREWDTQDVFEDLPDLDLAFEDAGTHL